MCIEIAILIAVPLKTNFTPIYNESDTSKMLAIWMSTVLIISVLIIVLMLTKHAFQQGVKNTVPYPNYGTINNTGGENTTIN